VTPGAKSVSHRAGFEIRTRRCDHVQSDRLVRIPVLVVITEAATESEDHGVEAARRVEAGGAHPAQF